jgi:hypothetical protein
MLQETIAALCRCAGGSPPNLLILGEVPSREREEVLHAICGACGRDAYHPQDTPSFELPPVSTSIVIIDDALALSADDQHALLHWLDRHRDATVLSFAEQSMFPLVMQGRVSEKLFYRLNMMTLSVDDEAS